MMKEAGAASSSKICPNNSNSKEDDDNGKVYLVGLPQEGFVFQG